MKRIHLGSAAAGAVLTAAVGVAFAGPADREATLDDRVAALEKQVAELVEEREAERVRKLREMEASLYERRRDATPDNRGRFFLVSPAADAR